MMEQSSFNRVDASHTARAHPVIILRATTGWRGLGLGEIYTHRELLMSFAVRDLKLRYKQTALGVGWVVLQPLIAALIFAFVFGRIAGLPTDNTPAFPFAFVGMIAWGYFSSIVTRSSQALVLNAQLLSKVFFPRILLPLAAVPSAMIDFLVSFAVCLVSIWLYGRGPSATAAVLLPVSMLVLTLLSAGVGLFASALAVWYRDVQYIVPVAVQILLFASPVAYSVTSVPHEAVWFYRLNPVSAPLECLRAALLGTPLPPISNCLYAAVVAVVALSVGALVFRRVERQCADVI